MQCKTVQQSPDIIGIGNAIVDECFFVSDALLVELGIEKGSMTLISKADLDHYHHLLKTPHSITPGGSIANTIVGLGFQQASCGYIGRVAQDYYGQEFIDKMSKICSSKVKIVNGDTAASGVCLVMITPDGERTMATFLGVCNNLNSSPEEELWASNAKIFAIEGYLCASPQAYESILRIADLCNGNHNHVALTLSSTSCIDFCFDKMHHLMEKYADIILGTVDEGLKITQTQSVEEAIACLQSYGCVGALTDGGNGAILFDQTRQVHIPVFPVEKIVDTTGAGDQFAAGYFYKFLSQASLEEMGAHAAQFASRVIGTVGAHPQ